MRSTWVESYEITEITAGNDDIHLHLCVILQIVLLQILWLLEKKIVLMHFGVPCAFYFHKSILLTYHTIGRTTSEMLKTFECDKAYFIDFVAHFERVTFSCVGFPELTMLYGSVVDLFQLVVLDKSIIRHIILGYLSVKPCKSTIRERHFNLLCIWHFSSWMLCPELLLLFCCQGHIFFVVIQQQINL